MFRKRSQISHGKVKKEKSLFMASLSGALIALAAGILLLLLLALAGLSLDDPDRFTPIGACAALCLSAILAGRLAAKGHGEKGLLCGLCAGLMLVGMLVLLAFACGNSLHLPVFAIGIPALLLISAAAGIMALRTGAPGRSRRKVRF